jgi:hypothetical protein
VVPGAPRRRWRLAAAGACDVAALEKSLAGADAGDLDALLAAALGGPAARAATRIDPTGRRLQPDRDAEPVSLA